VFSLISSLYEMDFGIAHLSIAMAMFCLKVQTKIIKVNINDYNMFYSKNIPLNFIIILDQTLEMMDTDYMSQATTLV